MSLDKLYKREKTKIEAFFPIQTTQTGGKTFSVGEVNRNYLKAGYWALFSQSRIKNNLSLLEFMFGLGIANKLGTDAEPVTVIGSLGFATQFDNLTFQISESKKQQQFNKLILPLIKNYYYGCVVRTELPFEGVQGNKQTPDLDT